ncbi:MAG TPA: hypothetical protein EYN38_03575 [Flavobacteriales bacterium]|nr:hypothetical protein [Flavobacteriales bacterium]HIA10696.1 hypothetical protein [Flavobacteriales bacterium]HIO72166.1 hypothetical protein [Flavobacteriales bacterium]
MEIKGFKYLILLLLVTNIVSMPLRGYCQIEEGAAVVQEKPKFVNPQKVSSVLKMNPFLILWGSIPYSAEYRLVVEFTTSAHQSTQIGVSYIDKSPLLQLFADSSGDIQQLIIKGGRFELSHRFYINDVGKYAPQGFFFSPHISYASAKLSTKYANQLGYYLRVTQFNINALAGFQWLLGGKFAINIYSGWGYKINKLEEHAPQQTIVLDGEDLFPNFSTPIKFTLGVYFGWAF